MNWEMVIKGTDAQMRLMRERMVEVDKHSYQFTDAELSMLADLFQKALDNPSLASRINKQMRDIIENAADSPPPPGKRSIARNEQAIWDDSPRPSKESDLYEGGSDEESGWERESSFKDVFGESEECNKALEDWDKKLRPLYTTGRNNALEHRNATKAWTILGELQEIAYDKKERHSSPVFQAPIVSRYQTAHLNVDDIPKAIACLAVGKINKDVIRIKETLGPLNKDGRGTREKEVEEPDPKDLPIESLKPPKEEKGSKFEYALEEYARWMINRGHTPLEAKKTVNKTRKDIGSGHTYRISLYRFLEEREDRGEGRYGRRFREWDRKDEKGDWKTQAEKHKGLSDQWTITRYHGWRKGKSGAGEDILVNTLSISKSGKVFYKIGFVVHMMIKLDSKKDEVKRLLDWRKW